MNNSIVIDFAYKLEFTTSEITEFISKNWLRQTLLSNNSFYEWQFKQPVDNKSLDYSILVISENKIVGFLGLNKRTFFLNRGKLNGAELTTWIINEEYRKKGLAKPMLQFIQNNFDVAYGANITIDALKVYLRLGFYFIKEIDRVFKILSFDKIKKIGVVEPTIRKIFKNTPIKKTSYKLIDYNSVVINKKFYSGFDRSIEHLEWRYKKHPYYEYKFLEVYNETEGIYVVFRTENINEEIKVMIVTDVFTSCEKSFDLSGIEEYAINNNIDFIEFYSTSSFHISNFVLNGYINAKELKDFVDIPYLYNPLENKITKSYSLIYFGKNEYIDKLINYNNIYITKSDCDLDRPNNFYLEKMGMKL